MGSFTTRFAGLAALLMALAAAPPGAHAGGDAAREPARTRAVTLTPHITELVFAAGAGDRIVATVTDSDYPPQARAIPRLGTGIHVDVEKTVAARPDIVIAWQPTGAAQTLAPMLKRLDIPLIYSQPKKLEDIPEEIERYGRLFDTASTARAKASELRRRIAHLRERYSSRPRVAAFIEIGGSPLYTIGSDVLLNDVLAACGAENVYAATGIAAPQVDPESVLMKDPGVVIVPARPAENVGDTLHRWRTLQLPAAMAGHIYGVDPDALFRPGPRLVDAAEQLCEYVELVRR